LKAAFADFGQRGKGKIPCEPFLCLLNLNICGFISGWTFGPLGKFAVPPSAHFEHSVDIPLPKRHFVALISVSSPQNEDLKIAVCLQDLKMRSCFGFNASK
jgi:hypothetical protein